MASRPAKRQRRSTIVRSEDEDSVTGSSPNELRNASRTSARVTSNQLPSTKPSTPKKRHVSKKLTNNSPKPSPEKQRKLNIRPGPANKSLHNFFGKATEDQRWHKRSATPEVSTADDVIDDIIDDDISDEELARIADRNRIAQTDISTQPSLTGSQGQVAPTSSQRFAKSIAVRKQAPHPNAVQLEPEPITHKPWADRYCPDNLDELAVHKKKVIDVQKWIDDVLAGRIRQRLLVLKGPAGSGKTSTLSLLAKLHAIEVVAWQNPDVSDSGIASAVQQFSDFLNRGGSFEALSFRDEVLHGQVSAKSQQRLLLVEEYPTFMTRSSNLLDIFRSVLLQYLMSNGPSGQLGRYSLVGAYPPVVLVISETLISSSTALSDSFTAHRLLGPELSNHPLVTTIEFNPVAPTFVQKALDIVVRKEARDSQRRRMPGPAVMSRLAEIGDIRSAVNSLEFFCARGDASGDWSGTVAGRTKKKANAVLTEMEKETLRLVSQRESTLDMFHAAGKIVYNKREDPRVLDTHAEPPPKPPDHLLYLYTPKVSQVNIEALLGETGTDIQTFISTLHENYVLSCNGDDFVESLDGCSQILSDSDILNPDSRSLLRSRIQGRVPQSSLQAGNSDMLRQDEISFQVASRGLLFSLPFPVQRGIPAGTRKQDAFKMFYPGSLRLWKPTEEIHDLVQLYVHRGGTDGSITLTRPAQMDGVAAWKSRGLGFGHSAEPDTDMPDAIPQARQTFESADNHVLEILPFLTRIKAARNEDTSTLRQITQFRGNALAGDEPFEEDAEPPEAQGRASFPARSNLLRKVEAAHNSLRLQQASFSGTQANSGGNSAEASFASVKSENGQMEAMEKLDISDDEIEDD